MTTANAQIIARSKHFETGTILSTIVADYPRIVHAEFMTHRMLSKNSSSSRAIPANTVIEQLEESPFIPEFWGMNQSGMQAKSQLEGEALELARQVWNMAGKNTIEVTKILKSLNVHKQLANRVSEWMQNIRVCISGTEWNNFHWLRNHGDAQPEIQDLAIAIESAMNIWDAQGKTQTLNIGEWHLPFYKEGIWRPRAGGLDEYGFTLEDARMISVSCAAQTSYRKNDDSLEKAKKLFDMFFNTTHIHASPSEHAATVMALTNYFKQNEIKQAGFQSMFEGMNEGATHVDKNGDIWSGNFKHFVQFRQLIPNHVKVG